MREIKFRFWDSVDKEWMVDGRAETNIYDFAFKPGMNWDFISKKEALDRVVVVQYTGLKDEMGADIYEADCLVCGDDGSVWVVEWSEYGKWIAVCGESYEELCEVAGDFNIVGNIHEHPELLKGE